MSEKIRIYGRLERLWKNDDGEVTQMERAYTDYTPDGEIAATGTEDFTPARWRAQVMWYQVWVHYGDHRRDGSRSYEYKGWIQFRSATSDERMKPGKVRKLLSIIRYSDAQDIRLKY